MLPNGFQQFFPGDHPVHLFQELFPTGFPFIAVIDQAGKRGFDHFSSSSS